VEPTITETTQSETNQLLYYLATNPDSTIRYHASDMILHIASYLSVLNSRIRLGGLFLCGNKTPKRDTLNGYILNVASDIKNVFALAAESEVGACFQNAQSGAPLRITLTELGHIQPVTPLLTDKSTAFGILNETIKQKSSTSMDMRYHWPTNRARQKQCEVFCRPGSEILGDYRTKHYSTQHHKDMGGLILHQANSLQVLRGCVKLLPLKQPHLRICTYAKTYPSTQRASQVRRVLAHMFFASIQSLNTVSTTIVP
jgi:hypothetical protein